MKLCLCVLCTVNKGGGAWMIISNNYLALLLFTCYHVTIPAEKKKKIKIASVFQVFVQSV